MFKQFNLLLVGVFLCLSPLTGQNNDDLVTEMLDSLISVTGLPSFSVAILKEDSIVFKKALGYADVENHIQATPITQYRLASVSKLLTVTALAKLVQAKKLEFDTEVSEYLPDFSNAHGITPKLLAGHLSGLGHYQMVDKIDRSKHYSTMKESLEVFENSPRSGTPGDKYQYSTHGFTLLSAVIERASGQPFLEYLKNEIFLPLKMDHTGPDDRLNPGPGMSALYNLNNTTAYLIQNPEDPSYKWGGGGMVGTPANLVRLARAYLNGFLLDDIRSEMWTSQKTLDGEETGVGIGWRIGTDFNGRKIRHHAGSMGGARSVLILYPDEEMAVACTTNSSWNSMVELNASMILEAYNCEYNDSELSSGRYVYTGECWEGQTAGQLVLHDNRGFISTPEVLKNWFKGASVNRLPIRHLNDKFWAIITPFGMAPLKLFEQDSKLIGQMKIREDREWTFEFYTKK